MSMYSWNPKKIEHVISIDEIANLVGMHPDTIRQAVARGENVGFPVFKADRRYTVAKNSLLPAWNRGVMSDMEGKRITIEEYSGERVVIFHNSDAPDSLKHIEAGRIITTSTGTGFQPAPFLAGLFSPTTQDWAAVDTLAVVTMRETSFR